MTVVETVQRIQTLDSMRAFAHPIRMALHETLAAQGPMTATQLAERLGQSVPTCSYHLRQLARFHLIVESHRGSGRTRYWRAASASLAMGSESGNEPHAARASEELRNVWLERQIGLVRAGLTRADSDLPEQWRDDQIAFSALAWLTPKELGELNEVLQRLAHHVAHRSQEPASRPGSARLVRLLAFGILAGPSDEHRVGEQI